MRFQNQISFPKHIELSKNIGHLFLFTATDTDLTAAIQNKVQYKIIHKMAVCDFRIISEITNFITDL